MAVARYRMICLVLMVIEMTIGFVSGPCVHGKLNSDLQGARTICQAAEKAKSCSSSRPDVSGDSIRP